jgi:HAE1 family hydrophobic/amphiphilic exporter-1
MLLTKISIKNPVFTTMVMLALVVMGVLSLSRMSIDEFPPVNFPIVVVQTEYPGASPESVESDVSRKLEEGINSVAVYCSVKINIML